MSTVLSRCGYLTVCCRPVYQLRVPPTDYLLVLRQLAKKLDLRDKVVATASVLLLRFYTRAALVETDIALLCSAAIYVAAKVQESPVHIRTLTHESYTLWRTAHLFVGDTTRLAEAEFYLISEVDAELVVHLPFAVLEDAKDELGLAQEDIDEAWRMMYGTFASDVPLLYPPHVICLTCVFMACIKRRHEATLHPVKVTTGRSSKSASAAATASHRAEAECTASLDKLRELMARHDIDRNEMARCTQHIISATEFRRQRHIVLSSSTRSSATVGGGGGGEVASLSKTVSNSGSGDNSGASAVIDPHKILKRAKAAFEKDYFRHPAEAQSASRQSSIDSPIGLMPVGATNPVLPSLR